ncbi:MAG: SPFH domain-containing protein [Bacillota bacterium]|nr:SPFH domain-containing protein [Bacillota bacterium]
MAFIREKNRNNFPKKYCFYSGIEGSSLLLARGKCEDDTIPQKIKRGILIHIEEGECALIVDKGKIYECSTKTGDFKYEGYMSGTYELDGLDITSKNEIKTCIVPFNFASGNDERELYYFNLLSRKVKDVLLEPVLAVYKSNEFDLDHSIRAFFQIGYSYRLVNPIHFYKEHTYLLDEEYSYSSFEVELQKEIQYTLEPLIVTLAQEGTLIEYLNSKLNILEDLLSNQLHSFFERYGMLLESFHIEDFNLDGIEQASAKEEALKMMYHTPTESIQKNESKVSLFINSTWICTCGSENSTKFCGNCGRKRDNL